MQTKQNSMVKAIAIGIGLLVFLMVAASLIGNYQQQQNAESEQTRRAALTPEQRKAENQAAQLYVDRAKALIGCNELIKADLKDPSSAEFLYDADQAPVTKRADGRFDVQQRIRANNSFGALELKTVDCRVSNSNGEWKGRIVQIF